MRFYEFANAEEQLGLLRTILNSTWSAIAQQAAAQKRAADYRRAVALSQARVKRNSAPKITAKPQARPIQPAPPKQDATAAKNPNGGTVAQPAQPPSGARNGDFGPKTRRTVADKLALFRKY
jgi:hypothetical protein